MDKIKYKLEPVGDLYRLKATRDFANQSRRYSIREGDYGGLVSNESNLSHEGDCWIEQNAHVIGNAKVTNDALVAGNATVSGHAWVRHNATVAGRAQIMGSAVIEDNAVVTSDAIVDDVACVGGFARIEEDAIIKDSARVYGRALFMGGSMAFINAMVTDGAFRNAYVGCSIMNDVYLRHGIWTIPPLYLNMFDYTIYVAGKDTVTIGCRTETLADWRNHADEFATVYGIHDPELYLALLNVCEKYMEEFKEVLP